MLKHLFTRTPEPKEPPHSAPVEHWYFYNILKFMRAQSGYNYALLLAVGAVMFVLVFHMIGHP